MYNDEQNPYLASGMVQHFSWAPLQQATCNVSAAAPSARHARGHGVFIQKSACSASCCEKNIPPHLHFAAEGLPAFRRVVKKHDLVSWLTRRFRTLAGLNQSSGTTKVL